MKRILVLILVVGLTLSVGAVSALAADPPYNGDIHGVITSDNTGLITGSVSGDYNLTITGQLVPVSEQRATFTGTVSGDINGTVSGQICSNGYDSLYGVIDLGSGYSGDPVRIVGGFVQSGIAGDFLGEIITGTEPAPVASLSIQSDSTTMDAGSTMQMTAVTDPAGPYDVLWSVWVNQKENGWIDQDGVLHALKAGTVTVIANTLDPSLATATRTITIEDHETEVTAAVDPTYTIVIPAAVDFGTLTKDSGVVSQPFGVSAQDVMIEEGYHIQINVDSTFKMLSGTMELAYLLYNNTAMVGDGGQFALFTADGTESGSVTVDTAAISNAGRYSGVMTFIIAYEN